VAIKHNFEKQPLAQESPNGMLDSGCRRKKDHFRLALLRIISTHYWKLTAKN